MLSLNKRALLGGAFGLGLQSVAAPSFALQTVRPRASTGSGYRLPTDRFAPRTTLAFWRSHGPDAVLGGSPDDYAPGVISERPNLHVHQPNIYARITQAEIDALRRPLDAAYRALIAQPSLSDIRGASLIGDRLIVRAIAESGLALRKIIGPIIAELSGAGTLPRLWHL